MPTAKVVNVTEHTAGSELVEAPYAGALWPSDSLWPSEALWPSAATQLSVVDPIDFDADGGYVTLVDVNGNEETVAYVFPDEDQDVLDLLTSLSGTYAEGDPVYLTDQNGRRYVERWADVMEPQAEEALRIRVPHALYALLPLGIREEGTEEQVGFASDGTDEVVTDILGKEPDYEIPTALTTRGLDLHMPNPAAESIRWSRESDDALGADITVLEAGADETLLILTAYKQGALDRWATVSANTPAGNGILAQVMDDGVPHEALVLGMNGTSHFVFDISEGWQNWTPTLTGWSANPTNTVYRYKQEGTKVTVCIRQVTNGTSNNVAKSITAPVTAATITNMRWEESCTAVDNGVSLSTPSRARITSGGSTISFDKDGSAADGWTASGGHRINACTLIYESAA